MDLPLIQLYEGVELEPGLEIDEINCVVRGVKALGHISKNGLVFRPHVRQKALHLMEGKPVGWNHAPKGQKETPLENKFGWLTDLREAADNCTRANLHYYADHPHKGLFLSMAKQNPKACGLSILGEAKPGPKDAEGRILVEEIVAVNRFDLVDDPANTMGLRESTDKEPSPTPGTEAQASTSDDYTAEGCLAAISEIIGSEGDARSKLEAIKKHMEQLESLEGEPKEEKETEMEESTKKQKLKEGLIALCESHNLPNPDPTFIQLLAHTPEDKRVLLIKRKAPTKKPQSGTQTLAIKESVQEETEQQAIDRIAKALIHL